MVCPYCSFSVPAGATTCPQCHIALTATANNAATGVVAARQITSQMRERRHWWVWTGGIGTIITGFVVMAGGGALVLLGLLVIVAGILTLYVTGFGARWDNLTGQQRATALPGVICGIAGIVTLGVVAAIAAAALKEEFKQ